LFVNVSPEKDASRRMRAPDVDEYTDICDRN
jgi:hypothetical protein